MRTERVTGTIEEEAKLSESKWDDEQNEWSNEESEYYNQESLETSEEGQRKARGRVRVMRREWGNEIELDNN